MSHQLLHLLTAAQVPTLSQAAQLYCQAGLSVLPLQGKRPALTSWKSHQTERAPLTTVQDWITEGLFQNVGLVCGAVSQNLVVLDLDGRAGYPAFAALFPELAETYTVATGSGKGSHVYWQVAQLPESIKAMQTPIGNLEICANGRQVVAPPSIHPDTGQPYRVQKALPVLAVEDMGPIVQWVQSFQGSLPRPTTAWQPPTLQSTESVTLNPHLLRALADHFSRLGYKAHGEWLHGPCIYPQRHQHGDRHPSFGFNTQTGYGYCYVCGTLLAKDMCEAVGIHPDQYGGLVEKPPTIPMPMPRPNLPTVPISLTPLPVASNPPLKVPSAELVLENLSLPPWLQDYLDWAGATGNQTPLSFHLFSGLWLAATAIGRRLYAEAPWGQTIYPNLYTIVVAVSTFYRKSTAYRLAEQVAHQVFPHLLLPTPGSPERLLTSLAGALPPNFKDLTATQQEQLQKARPFAAQRALRVDEIAGLLSAVNKRDYMVGMKDHLLEIYDCPPVLTRDIQTGLTIIERPTLSIFGLTTPAALASAVGFRDWMDGLFPRFLLISPESNYQERPPLTTPRPIPESVVQGLNKLFNRLPTPPDPHGKTLQGLVEEEDVPTDLEWAVQVECWEACMAYGERLRRACDPQHGNTLEERLRPLYGRLHVQALKLAMLLGALRWLESADPAPTITRQDWDTAEALAEYLRASAHQLLLQLDRSGEASREQSLQDRMLEAFSSGGTLGRTLREVYRHLHLPAKQARQLADDLVLAGLLIRSTLDGAESYSVRLSQAG